MKRREEIFNEVLENLSEGKNIFTISITDELRFAFVLSDYDAIMEGNIWNWFTNKETRTRKVAKMGEFEDDLYYLIDLLIEDAKVAQMV